MSLAHCGSATALDSFHHSAVKVLDERTMTHASSSGWSDRSTPKDCTHADSQDPFMQLITEQFGGDTFHFQSSTQSHSCSSYGGPLSDRDASFLYSSTQSSYCSSSAALQLPHGAEQGSQVTEHPLSLTLEEIYHGGMKQVECMRTLVDGESGHDMPVTELVNVRITPGVREGTRLLLKELGDEHIGRKSSDVALVVREELHPQFKRKGNDLLTRVEVPLVQALTSNYVEVPLLDGDTMEVAVRGPLNPESEVVLPGMGMPKPEDPAQTGDLHVRFKISFPQRVNSEQKVQLQAALS